LHLDYNTYIPWKFQVACYHSLGCSLIVNLLRTSSFIYIYRLPFASLIIAVQTFVTPNIFLSIPYALSISPNFNASLISWKIIFKNTSLLLLHFLFIEFLWIMYNSLIAYIFKFNYSSQSYDSLTFYILQYT